jgi:hypothetical protein
MREKKFIASTPHQSIGFVEEIFEGFEGWRQRRAGQAGDEAAVVGLEKEMMTERSGCPRSNIPLQNHIHRQLLIV